MPTCDPAFDRCDVMLKTPPTCRELCPVCTAAYGELRQYQSTTELSICLAPSSVHRTTAGLQPSGVFFLIDGMWTVSLLDNGSAGLMFASLERDVLQISTIN